MTKATSRATPPSRKPETSDPLPDDALPLRWSDDDLHRVLALATLGVTVFGAAWLNWRSGWLLWPVGLCALAVQMSATMIAARSAVNTRRRPRKARRSGRRPVTPTAVATPAAAQVAAEANPSPESILSILARLLPPDEGDTGTGAVEISPDQSVEHPMPAPIAARHDAALHRAFFRGIVESEFREHAPGTVWPDLSLVQGSLATRLRLFQRHPAWSPVAAGDVSDSERGPHSPWTHLAALEAADYRRGDTLARLSHRALAPMAFLELHARLDIEPGERESLESEVERQYTVGYGRVLTSPMVLSAADPLRLRFGGPAAIALADEARLALRSTSTMADATSARAEWHERAWAARAAFGWAGEVQAVVEALIDYWLVQRAAAADIDWARAQTRLDGGTIGQALAQRDATGEFHFAEALRTVCGGASRPQPLADGQVFAPTTAATVA